MTYFVKPLTSSTARLAATAFNSFKRDSTGWLRASRLSLSQQWRPQCPVTCWALSSHAGASWLLGFETTGQMLAYHRPRNAAACTCNALVPPLEQGAGLERFRGSNL